jgi:phage terminase large subunit-like protein
MSRHVAVTSVTGTIVTCSNRSPMTTPATAWPASWYPRVLPAADHLEVRPLRKIDVQEVEATIREACKRWNVLEVTADPYRWTRTLQVLADERIPVSEFPQSPSRMTPATTALYEAVVNGAVTHDGDKRLARHVTNAVLRVDSRGSRLQKEHRDSKRRIDLAVAAVMTHDRARALASRPKAQIHLLDG